MQFFICSKVFLETKEGLIANKGLEIRKMSHGLLMRMLLVYEDCSDHICHRKVYTEDDLQSYRKSRS